MARGRMIARNITKSKKIAQLSDAQRVMYAFILPFLDREGRINAPPTYLKGNVFLSLEYTEAQIEDAVARFHDVGLATVYPTEDAVVMEYTAFTEFNRPDRREVASEYPPPSDELLGRPEAKPTTPRRAPSPVNYAETPRNLPVNSVSEVEVEVEVEREVEVEVEEQVETKKNEVRKFSTPATARRTESFTLIQRRLGTRHTNRSSEEDLDLVTECLAEDPSRDRWFDILPARVQALIAIAKREQQDKPGKVFKSVFIDLLDREALTDTVTTTAKPPLFRAPPPAGGNDELMREALGEDVYNEMMRSRSSCGEQSTP